MSNYLSGKDCAAVMYLEDPVTTCAKTRTYYGATISVNSAFETNKTFLSKGSVLGAFLTLRSTNRTTITGNIRVVMTITYQITQGSVIVTKYLEALDTTIPYTDVVGYSAFDTAKDPLFLSSRSLYSLSVKVYNYTNQSIYASYLTLGPLALFKGGPSLVGMDFGGSLGDDEKTITLGVCKDFGSIQVKDTNKRLLELLNDPTIYELDSAISHYPMRVECLIGQHIYGVFEVARLEYDDGSHKLNVELQSPIEELERILVEPLYYTSEMSLASFVDESIDYAVDMGHGTMLSMFDFTTITNTGTSVTACLGRVKLTPLIQATQIDMGQLLEWVAQAAAINISINPTMGTDMHYRFLMVPWFGDAARISVYGSKYCEDLSPTDLLANPSFTPLKENYVDKITYESRALQLADEETTVTETFSITTKHAGNTQADVKNYWIALSEMLSTDSLNDHDTWYGDRGDSEGRGPKHSELSYNSSSGKVHTSYRNLRYMMAKASTRSLLYRFRFNTAFNDVSSTTIQTKWQNVVDEAAYIPSSSDIPSDLPSTESTRLSKLLSRQSAWLPAARYNTQIEMPYEDSTVNGKFWQHGNALCPGGMYTIPHIFSNFQNLYTLRLKLPATTRFVEGSPITLTIKFTYWYTKIFGGWDATTLESSRWAQRYAPGAYLPDGTSRWTSPYCYEFNEFTSGMSEMADYFCVQMVNDQKQVQTRVASCDFVQSGDYYIPQYGGSNLPFYEINLWTWHALTANTRQSGSTSYSHWYENTGQTVGTYTRYNRLACPPKLYDNQNPSSDTGVFGSNRYFHTGEDDGANGNPVVVKVQSLSLSDVIKQPNSVSIPVALPTSSAAVSKVRETAKSNFFGTNTSANAYCCYVNPPYHFSYLYTNGIPVSGGAYLERNMSFDKPIYDTNDIDNDNGPNYFPSNPVYGYLIKDVIASVTYTPYTVENLGEKTKQYNEFGRSNYELSTNDLMIDEGNNKTQIYTNGYYRYLLTWLVEAIANYFQYGRNVASVKTRMKFYRTGSYDKLPVVGDTLESLQVSKNGSPTDLVEGSTWRVKSVEYVYNDGDSYCLLGLMEN